jgi:hypothetical protein
MKRLAIIASIGFSMMLTLLVQSSVLPGQNRADGLKEAMKVYLIPFEIDTYVPVTMADIEVKSHFAIAFRKSHTFVTELRSSLTSKRSNRIIDDRVIRMRVQLSSEVFFVDQDGVVLEQTKGARYELSKDQRAKIETEVARFAGVMDLKMPRE